MDGTLTLMAVMRNTYSILIEMPQEQTRCETRA